MKINIVFYLLLVFLIFGQGFIESYAGLSRRNFPAGFTFGAASSAYQYEGAAMEDGRGPSIWDTFIQNYPYKIRDHTTGNVGTDSYSRYEEDVGLIKGLGFNAYRFSISWSRLLPYGRLSKGINQRGINYYNNLIDELLLNGIQPFVTLFHWDLPQALEDEYGGFLSPKIVNDFRDYAELCFQIYGDRVKRWITVNEPLVFVRDGYGVGTKAPGRCSNWLHLNCSGGDSSTEPYLVVHHELLAHAAVVKLYKDKYQASQKGQIGITINSDWVVAVSESSRDSTAASRALTFGYDWLMEPLHSGLYPKEMVKYVGERMPKFSKEQSLMVKGSFDFIGLNYYTTLYAIDVPCKTLNFTYATDSCVNLTGEFQGIPIGPKTGSTWLYVYPKGIEELLLYTKAKYNNSIVYITENGVSDAESNIKSTGLNDQLRVNYYNDHLSFIHKAIKKGVNIKGYFTWSLLDNFEWEDGYSV